MDPMKFIEMELVDDEDVETMFALYCEEHGAQESYIVVPISYIDNQSTIRGIDIDLNTAPEIDVVGDDVYNSSDPSDHDVNSDSDPDVDEVPDDINDEGVNNNGNVNAFLVGNQICRIVIHNNPEAHISQMDPDATHAADFLKYPEILPAHRLAVDSVPGELFVG
ncbi:hypothetical protein GOBAR_AA15154 [Gossypium barbadense]|uniref:Uncharacterized protein n=1 Tax=Gossypium barbadense TaxID=3634 RepID=A0A2P5XQ68_GOSBA|nr:hypothetical protein GOBAR_AA15154 [Gossypium barbadense]